MQRCLLVVMLALWIAAPAAGQDPDIARIGRELGRMNDTLQYGPIGGGFGAALANDFSGIMINGLAYHPYYFSERGIRERKSFQTRLDRAKAKRQKQAARRVR